MSLILPTCPDGCETTLPVVDFSKCTPVTHAAGIQRIFLTNQDQPMSNWTSAVAWAARLSNTTANVNDIRTLFVVGSKAAPEKQVIKISLGREVVGKKKHSILFKIDETTDDNYELLRTLECNYQLTGWYESGGLMLYGGNDGIVMSITMDDILVEDSGQLETFDGIISWEAQFHPQRIASPIAL